jgi:predicted RNA-binding Zn-ribbon protein involved in translation (DUF1610 family)
MEPVPNFQCPRCGKMSVMKGYFDVLIGASFSAPPNVPYCRYKCLSCGCIFG